MTQPQSIKPGAIKQINSLALSGMDVWKDIQDEEEAKQQSLHFFCLFKCILKLASNVYYLEYKSIKIKHK